MNNKIKLQARKLRKALHGDASFSALKDYIESRGYVVAFIGTADGDDLIRKNGLTGHANKRAFTYVKCIRLIFLQKDLEEFEKVHYLLHEIGHIELGHVDKPGYEIDDMTAELEAENYVHEVLYYKPDYKSLLFGSLRTLVILIAFNTAYTRAESITDTSKDNIIVAKTVEVTEETEPTVYITPSGKCYHDEKCNYVGQNPIAVSLSQVEQSYLPCCFCDPIQK
jgi:hypothetical protein